MIVRARFNPCFAQANATRRRYRVLMGGAGSGKSCNVAQDFVLKLMDPKFAGANLLVLRKVEESNRSSTYPELLSAIRRICGPGWSRVWISRSEPLGLRCVSTGNEILFKGMKDGREREKLKSISCAGGKLTWVWMEEATEFLPEDLELVDDRLRGLLPEGLFYQITLTFNPVSASHWLKKRFFDRPDGQTFLHHSTYLDNAFVDGQYQKRMEGRRERDPEGYRVYALGEWGESGGLILPHYKAGEFSAAPHRFDGMALGQDFGFNHPNAILLLGFKDGAVFACDELIVREKDTGEIMALAEERFDKRLPLYCDSAEPDRIRTWRAGGWRARPARKGPGSVRAQIDWLKARSLLIHPRCTQLLAELQSWKWRRDSVSGEWLDEPSEGFDDAIAALRYGIEGWRRTEISFE